jgi:adenylate kinase
MIFILIGPPGAGKGTHSDALLRDFSCIKVATGDILRRHIKEGTPIGKQCQEIIAKGMLVDDAILWQLLAPELRENAKRSIILDGYPRNLEQARQLQTVAAANPIAAVVHIEAREATLVERLCGRQVCPNCQSIYHSKSQPPKKAGICDNCGSSLQIRPDDQADKVKKRLEVFAAETLPIVRFYQDLGFYHAVDGNGDIAAVYRQIKAIYSSKMGV